MVGVVGVVPLKLGETAWVGDGVLPLTVDALRLYTPDTEEVQVLVPVMASVACDELGTVEVVLPVTCGAVVPLDGREVVAWLTVLGLDVVAALVALLPQLVILSDSVSTSHYVFLTMPPFLPALLLDH